MLFRSNGIDTTTGESSPQPGGDSSQAESVSLSGSFTNPNSQLSKSAVVVSGEVPSDKFNLYKPGELSIEQIWRDYYIKTATK